MSGSGDRKALAVELFEVTGEAVPESDPIVTGAIFFAYKLGEAGRVAEDSIRSAAVQLASEIREAGRLANEDIRQAGEAFSLSSANAVASAEKAAQTAAAAIEKLAAERSQLFKAVDAHLSKSLKVASKGQSGVAGFRSVPVWYALGGAVAIGLALAVAFAIGLVRGSAQAEEAAVGRSFARVLPTMEPKLKQQLMEHVRNSSR